MPGLVLVERGMLDSLDALRASWVGNLSVALMQGPAPPQKDWTLANIVPATFSGHGLPILLTAWSVATILGDRAVAKAAPVIWVHNGGVVGNWITGWYVVNGSGQLVMVRLFDGPAILMNRAGHQIVTRVEFTLGSRFPLT